MHALDQFVFIKPLNIKDSFVQINLGLRLIGCFQPRS